MKKNQKPSKDHHYLSQFYLTRFTKDKTRDSKLITLFLQTKEQREIHPKKIAKEMHFNTIDSQTLPPDFLEVGLREFERKVNTAICEVEKTQEFDGKNRGLILEYIAWLAVRNPYRRQQCRNIMQVLGNTILSRLADNVEQTATGNVITGEQIKNIKDNKLIVEITVPRNIQIECELNAINEIVLSLNHRKWALIQAPNDMTFLTSDFPVGLIWVDPNKKLHPPGFSLTGTQVHFALSKEIALVGDFSGVDEIVDASAEVMGLINSNILSSAQKQVYTPNEDFYFFDSQGNLSYGIDKFWETRNVGLRLNI